MINYDLADILNRLQISAKAYDKFAEIRITKLSKKIIALLYRQGIISGYYAKGNDHFLVKLKYFRSKPFVKRFKIISSPGRRVYWKMTTLSKNYNKNGMNAYYIISTPEGLLTSVECLLLKRISGEVLFKVELN